MSADDPRTFAARLLITARQGYVYRSGEGTRAYVILRNASDAAARHTVYSLNRGSVERAKVYASAWTLLANRRQIMMERRTRDDSRAARAEAARMVL